MTDDDDDKYYAWCERRWEDLQRRGAVLDTGAEDGLVSVIAASTRVGFIRRTRQGVEALDTNKHSMGFYDTKAEAALAVLDMVR